MLRYALKRFLSLLISLAVASLVIFMVIEVAPGDPASFMLGLNAQPETLAALRSELGLDQSRPERYHVLEHAAELDARPVLYRIDAERGTGEDAGCFGSRVGV